MSLDRTSETIAHFSGLFQKILEEARLRKEYSDFKATEAKEAEEVVWEFAPPRITTDHSLKDFNPDVSYVPKIVLSSGQVAQPATPNPNIFAASIDGGGDLPFDLPSQGSDPSGISSNTVISIGGLFSTITLPFVAIPSSVVTITLQSLSLRDDDIFGNIEGLGFRPLETFVSQLNAITGLAESLAPWSTETLAQDILDDPSAALMFRNELEALATEASPSFAAVFSDDEVQNVYVNGEVVEELPQVEELLPAFIKSKRDAAKAEAEASQKETLAGEEKSDPGLFNSFESLVASFANSGHNVTTGANEAVNLVDLQITEIDASVIAVFGDYIEIDAIAQLNILSDHNFVDGVRQNDSDVESKGYNIASVVEKEASETLASGSSFPEFWNTVNYTGDVTITNVVKQHTIATDTDQLNLTFTANSTAIVTGENQMSNIAAIDAFGTDYDLIVVSGSMTNVNVVNQTNVLLDDDYFSGAGLNHAAISDGDNVLHNKVDIAKTGVDTQSAMKDELKQAFDDLKQGVENLVEAVAQSAIFQGLMALKVLHIDGNLTQMNIVDQINYIADQDQLHMAANAVKSAIDDVPVSLTTGSNLLSNETYIKSNGKDSDIIVGGDYYDDALLYQADLIDTGANPLGVSINELASEAVAFLADDMITKSISEQLEDAGFAYDDQTGGHTFDVMQSMLS